MEHENAQPSRDLVVQIRVRTLEPSSGHGGYTVEEEEEQVFTVGKAERPVGDVFVEDAAHEESDDRSSRFWQERRLLGGGTTSISVGTFDGSGILGIVLAACEGWPHR